MTSSPLGASLGAPLDRAGRVKVAPDLSVPGHPEIFVAGDLAALEGVPGHRAGGEADGPARRAQHHPPLEGRPRAEFRYRDYGQLATIGRNAAVAMYRALKLSGSRRGWSGWWRTSIS